MSGIKKHEHICYDQLQKMKKWHNGERNFNYKACSDDKLEICYRICKDEGFDEERRILKNEMKKRHILDPHELAESYYSVDTYGKTNGKIEVSDNSFYDTYYRLYDRICDALKECIEMYGNGEESMPLSLVGFREYDDIHISGSTGAIVFDRDGYDYNLDNLEFVELCSLTDKLYDYCIKNCVDSEDISEHQSVYNSIMERLSSIVKQSLKENEYWDEPFRDDEQTEVNDIQGDTEKWINALKVFFEDIYDEETMALKFYVTIKQLDMHDDEQLSNFVWTLMPIATKYVNCPPVDEIFVQSIVDEIKNGLCDQFMQRVQEGYSLI